MRHLVIAILGIVLGFSLSRIGFADWGEVHRMFTFADLRMTMTFGGAVAILVPAFWLLRGRLTDLPPRRVHKGIVPGAILFGIGWALTGTCPGIVMVQLGEGRMPALLSLLGMFAGMAIYAALAPRFFRWEMDSCES